MDETLPKQEQLSKPESLATPDVTKALDTINYTETKIGEHFGLAPDAPELPDLTDDALVHVAESSSDLVKDHPEQSEVAMDAVKTVLIEGALEVTGDRPEGTENPIIKFENDGYDAQITEAVRQFHEEGEVLPNGQSVAETIAITITSQEMTSEEYDSASKEAGWDSPERAQKLVGGYVTPGSKVLDIGIGTGQAVNGYAEKGATVIGLDHDASMLDKASSTVHRHTAEKIQGLLEQKGYKLLSQDAYNGYQREDGEVPYGIFLAQKQAETLTSKPEIESYKGNWFNLQQERMSSPDFREKFERFIEEHKGSLNAGEPSSMLQKPESFQSHYQSQLDEFDANLERISGSVGYGNAAEVGGKSAGSLGHGRIGETGTVYLDAIHQDGTPLTDEQKDIIAAHEAYHGMIDAQGSAAAEIKSGFDWGAYNELVDTTDVKQPSYLRNPDELTARMAQFKNYFGMQGGEQFTPDHLDYLKQHYLEDTGLDNGISTMLKMVTPATETQFIELMNKLPV